MCEINCLSIHETNKYDFWNQLFSFLSDFEDETVHVSPLLAKLRHQWIQ